MASTVDLSGLRALQSRLAALPAEVQKSIATGALRTGAEVVAQEARIRAPVARPNLRNRKRYGLTAGSLRDSIRVTDGVLKNGIARVSVLVGSHRKGDSHVYYAKWVEFGTAAHWISVRADVRRSVSVRTLNRMAQRGLLKIGENFVGASVLHPGARPRPFLRPAMDEKQSEALSAIQTDLAKRIKRYLRGIKQAA